MSASFTTPSGETLQSLAFYNELQLAYSERRQALDQSAQSAFSEDAYWQKLSMYQGWQNWMEANCTSFIDHVSGPLNPGETNFLYFTLATWRAAAGLNASGFLRYDKDGNFIAYGIAQDDDLICDTLFLELQAGFGALLWSYKPITWSVTSGSYVSAHESTWDAAKAACESAWPQSPAYTDYPHAFTLGHYVYDFNAQASRVKTSPTVSTATIPHTVDFYIRGYRPNVIIVYDDYGDGITESASLYLKESSGEISTDSWTGTEIGGTTFPLPWCDEPGTTERGYFTLSGLLLKWNFTNA